MKKESLSILFLIVLVLGFSSKSFAVEKLGKNYYPYNPRWADIYVGLEVNTAVDQTASKEEWAALFYPLKMLNSGGFGVVAGIRPLAIFPFIRNFRFEGQISYEYSNYQILHDPQKGSWKPAKDLPTQGKVFMKDARFVNAYYDIRWFSDTFYPYIGAGVGVANVGVKYLDISMLQNGIGQEYMGRKDSALVKQFMAGVQYDTKIFKASFFVEYRYLMSGSFMAYPKYFGDEPYKNGKPTNPVPPGFKKATPRSFTVKMQTIVAGVKYYLY